MLTIYLDHLNIFSCFLDINPISEDHVLVVPKKHCLDTEELDSKTRLDIMNNVVLLLKSLKTLYIPDGITVMQNGGYFNDVNHYHMHVFPRYKDDGFGWIEPNSSTRNNNLSKTATNLNTVIKKLTAG